MNCPHCGGLIEIIAGQPVPDSRQSELPFVVELRLPTKYGKKILASEGGNFGKIEHGAQALHDHDSLPLLKAPRAHEHDHDHGGHALRREIRKEDALTPAQQDLLDQINELVANENRTQHFRSTWVLRLRDYPVQVFSAIGETRAAKREGAIRKSVGGYLNWQFQQFRETARLRKAC